MPEIRICALFGCDRPVERSNSRYCCLAHKQLGYRQRSAAAVFPSKP